MRGKLAKRLRKATGTTLGKGYKPDYRVLKEVKKMTYFQNRFGETKSEVVTKKVIVNAAKYNYRKYKKMVMNNG